ncbi:uncharacterized protein LOC105193375 [Solenopsis invicta]|uniref:uncharacterized protein LOC105193375 n=1 Tax=Solenopsis invicta TaxID=13686 RepID=UPI00059599A1|nr:uncharacterized protein LOC105193375 [Solenopsis invicta]
MTKLAIISCIIAAVCIFQTAEAGIFDSPLGGLLDGAKGKLEEGRKGMVDGVKGIEDKIKEQGKGMLDSAKELEEKAQKGVKDAIDHIKTEIEKSKEQLQNGLACTKLYKEGQEVFNNVVEEFQTCFKKETKSATGNIQKLASSVSRLEESLSNIFQKLSQCIEKSPMNFLSCFSEIPNSLQQLGPQIEDIVYTAYELIGIFPKVASCYEQAITKVSGKSLNNLVTDGGKCIQSVLSPLNNL